MAGEKTVTEWTNVPIRDELVKEIDQRARRENRNRANMVEVLLRLALAIEVAA